MAVQSENLKMKTEAQLYKLFCIQKYQNSNVYIIDDGWKIKY